MAVLGMYGDPDRRLEYQTSIKEAMVLKLDLSKLHNSRVGKDMTDDDAYAISSFKWLFRQETMSFKAFTRALALFNEHVRVLLIADKLHMVE